MTQSYTMTEHAFLHFWAQQSIMPALLCWGLREGVFRDDGKRLSVAEISTQLGYTRAEVTQMLNNADRLIQIVERENEETPARLGLRR